MAELHTKIDAIDEEANDPGPANSSGAQRHKKFIEEAQENKKALAKRAKRTGQKNTNTSHPSTIDSGMQIETKIAEKKLPSGRWKELIRYELNFYVDIEIFLALESFLLKHLFDSAFELVQKQSKQAYSALFDLYKKFDKSSSFLIHLSQQTDYQEITEKNFSIIVKHLFGSICKDRNYFDNVAKLLVNILEKQAENNNLIQGFRNKLSDVILDQLLPGNICLKLIETYPSIIQSKYLHIRVIDFLDKLIALPMQYITKLPLLFDDLKNDTKGYDNEIQQLKAIQQRIGVTAKGTNKAQISSDFGNNPHLSTALPIRQQAHTLEHLKLGIAYIFQIITYYEQLEFNKDENSKSLFLELLENARHIFINISKTPGAIETLKESLQKIKLISNLPSELSIMLQHCLDLLEGDLTATSRIDSILEGKITVAKKLTNSNEAFLYSCATIIDWVINEIKVVQAYNSTKNTLPAVKNIIEFIPRFFSNPEGSMSILNGLRLKAFKDKLKQLKTYSHEDLNNLIQSLNLPFQRNIAHLIVYLFAEASQFCGRKLSFVDIGTLSTLMSLLKTTDSFLNNQNQSTHQLIVDAYLKINIWQSNLPATSADTKNLVKPDILHLINMLNVINKYGKHSEKYSDENPTFFAKKIIIKLCFQLKRNEALILPIEELKLAIQKITPQAPDDKSWLIPSLINLVDKKLFSSMGAPPELLIQHLTWQTTLHYLYKCIVQQCAYFFINYAESTTASTIKNRTTATAKQRYAIYCCERLEELYRSSLKTIKQKIERVGPPNSKSIIGLIKSELSDWENYFDERQRNSINTKGEITEQVIPALHAFLDELDTVVSPKNDTQQPTSSTSTNLPQ